MYTIKERVRYSEVNADRRLELYAILNYFQDVTNFHSQDSGVGIDYVTERGRVWLLSSWQIEIEEPPELFDEITVGTWPYEFKGLYGFRNFILYNETKGHTVAAYANSVWFLMDVSSMRPAKIEHDDIFAYPLEPAYPMEYKPRRIALPKKDTLSAADVLTLPAIPVTEHMLDTNHHVNNGWYVRLAENCLVLSEEDASKSICSMRAEYSKSAVLKDSMVPVQIHIPGTCEYYLSMQDESGQPYAIVEFTMK